VCLFLKIYDPFVYIILLLLYTPLKRCGDLARARQIVTFIRSYIIIFIYFTIIIIILFRYYDIFSDVRACVHACGVSQRAPRLCATREQTALEVFIIYIDDDHVQFLYILFCYHIPIAFSLSLSLSRYFIIIAIYRSR